MSRQKGLIPLLLLSILAGSQGDIDIGFVIESAGGIAGNEDLIEGQKWNTIKEFVSTIITALPRHCTKVGLIIFSERSDLTLPFKLTNDPHDARNHILTLQSHGSSLPTNTSLALYKARTELFNVDNGDREDAHNVAVVITHSRIVNPNRTIAMAQELHKHGVKVISVCITDNTDPDVLRAMSSPPHTPWADYYPVSDFQGQHTHISTLIGENIKSYKTTSFGYKMDIGFIIDSSGSLSYEGNWEPLLKFIGTIIDHLPRAGTQVGAVIYSDSAWVLFSLDKYKDLCEVKQEILKAPNIGDITDTAAGLHIAHTELFNVANGDRQDVPNVAIVITDGRVDTDPYGTISETATALHDRGINVLCIGMIGTENRINEDELTRISSPPHQKNVNYFIVNAEQLGDIMNMLLVQIGTGQPATITRSIDSGKLQTSSPARTPTLNEGTDVESKTNLILYVVVPVLGGLLIVAVVLTVGCALHKRRKRAADTENKTHYENHSVGSKTGKEKNTARGVPVYDEANKAHIYDEAAPAHIYDDASSTLPHPQQPVEPHDIYSNASGVLPPIYDLAEPSDGAYSQVNPAVATQQQEPPGKESLYSQVQRKRSYIYAQVQKKKSYIYAQVNKVKKGNTHDT